MTGRERVRRIIAGEAADRCGFWLGNPFPDTWPILHRYFGTSSEEELRRKLRDDFRWYAVWDYREPGGMGMFAVPSKVSHGDPGPLAHCTDPGQIESYHWPKVEYIDFEPTLQRLREAGDHYRASGMWTSFYHNIMDLFGMEAYMMNMYDNPTVVQAVTDRVCQFYYDANEIFFERAGNLVDGYFFGNDFGTQLDLICGPAQFEQFIMPWFHKFTEQGHRWGKQVILHSCGAIHRVIPRLVELGVECLHPLQAKARNMEAERLAAEFKGKVAFLGGIDTQDLLVNGTPEQVKEDVRRVKRLLGPCLIVSPSHEAILPNVPPENIEAMAEAAVEEELSHVKA